jgi:hypothetical protein
VLIASVVSAAAAVPALLSTPRGFVSEAEVFVAPLDLVDISTRSTPPLARALSHYAGTDLGADVRADLGGDASEVRSIEASEERDVGLFAVTVEARSGEVATRAAELAAASLIEESNTLVDGQVEALRDSAEANLAALASDRAALRNRRDGLLGRAESSPEAALELREVHARLALSRARRSGLIKLVQEASALQVSREPASMVVSGPTEPQTDFTVRAIETIGLALVIGLVVATLTIVWLERRTLLPTRGIPPRPPAPRSAGDAYGMFHPSAPRAGDPGNAHSSSRGART